ncbi:MAG: hypothetical protein QOG34_2571 [Frankiaceae bacterium]|jgi:hypothetical protein|nr:hypothetical protein [Frankiaceae bacterium]
MAAAVPSARLLLEASLRDVAAQLGMRTQDLRAAVFALDDDGMLRIVPDLCQNFSDSREISIEIRPGEGTAGRAWATAKQHIAVFANVAEESTIGDRRQRELVEPELRWIVSTPVLDGTGRPMLVLNIDGLREERDVEQLAKSAATLFYWCGLLAILMGVTSDGLRPTRAAGVA